MALTVSARNSNIYYPAYNEMIWVVSGSNVSQPNFRFLVEIYDENNTTKLVPTIKTSPVPGTSTGFFDLHRILESYVTTQLKVENTGFAQVTGGIYKVTLRFGEEYGATVTQTLNITTYTTAHIIPMAWDWQNWQNTSPNSLISSYVLGSNARRFLASMPHSSTAPAKIRSEQNAWLYILTGSTANICYKAQITTYDSSGATIATHEILNSYAANTSTADRYLRFPSGTHNLNDIPSGQFITSFTTIITASVASYKIQMYNITGTATSENFYYTIDDTCTEHTVYRLHFLNKYAGYDSFNFIRKSTSTTEVLDRPKYKKITGSLSGTTWGYNLYDKVNAVYNLKFKDRIQLNTDWISEGEADALKFLFTSPEVYYESDTSSLVAVNIMDTSYEFKKVANYRLIQYTITIEYTFDGERQRY